MKIENRKHIRFLPQENAFAALGKNYTKVGKVRDICKGGLAFEYIAGETTRNQDTQVDIFLTGNVFHLYNVPCEVVYEADIHVPHVNTKFVRLLTTRRCGIKFGDLSESDIRELDKFLAAHTIGPA